VLIALDRPAWTGVVAAVVVALVLAAELLVVRRADDRPTRFQLRRTIRYMALLVLLIALAGVWHVFHGRVALVVGLGAASLGFALQNVLGAIFGWISILSGRIFRVGDRISFAGVEGDVIDLTPLRTTILEMGTPVELSSRGEGAPAWVRGRQYPGRIVAVPNYQALVSPVYNYSAVFEYIWEELTLPVSYRSDWRKAEEILLEEVERVSESADAQRAMHEMTRRYPVPESEVEPRVFVRATDNWWEMAARFVVPVRTARTVKSELTKRIRVRFEEAGIELSSTTSEQFVRFPDGFAPPQ
jgi:small-conductance mechanosensitive channel